MEQHHSHRERELDDLIKETEKINSLDTTTDEGNPQPRKRRSRRAQADNVILSSKFVVSRIRSRYESTEPESGTYWCEFPRSTAETLEKRGIEIVTNPDERVPPRKLPTTEVPANWRSATKSRIRPKHSLSSSWHSFSDFPAATVAVKRFPINKTSNKRDSKGRLKRRHSSADGQATSHQYCLNAKDIHWLNVYNQIVRENGCNVLGADELERMINALESKKNETIIKKLKNMTLSIVKTPEGTSRRFGKEYSVMQKFLQLSPEVFPTLNYETMGKSLGLSPVASFDVWEYWKCKLQDEFRQPLVTPLSPDFDYRRTSLIAAWNMLQTPFSQKMRHDAEKVRLLLDMSQKRNTVISKIASKEEDLTTQLCDLVVSSDSKHLSLENMPDFYNYIKAMASDSHSHFSNELHDWVDKSLALSEPLPSPKEESPALMAPRRQSFKSAKSHTKSQPLQSSDMVPEQDAPVRKRKVKEKRPPVMPRTTRARLEPAAKHSFEHADNSCCENGPVDEGELLQQPGAAPRPVVKIETYDATHGSSHFIPSSFSDLILQEKGVNSPSKTSNMLSRLRSRKERAKLAWTKK